MEGVEGENGVCLVANHTAMCVHCFWLSTAYPSKPFPAHSFQEWQFTEYCQLPGRAFYIHSLMEFSSHNNSLGYIPILQ